MRKIVEHFHLILGSTASTGNDILVLMREGNSQVQPRTMLNCERSSIPGHGADYARSGGCGIPTRLQFSGKTIVE